MPPSPSGPAAWPRRLVVLASAPIVFHLGSVLLAAVAAPSGPWPTGRGRRWPFRRPRRPRPTQSLAVVLAKMGVVPVEAGIGELDPVGEVVTDLDRRLGVDGGAVVAVVEPEAVPVNGRRDVAVVRDVDE